jgi:RNA-directed DNA polymerase
VRLDRKAKKAVRARLRRLTARNWGVSMERRITALNRFIAGWCAYFALAETPSSFAELDQWLRRRLRQCQWRQWRRVRTRVRELQRLGVPYRHARHLGSTRKGPWRVARALSSAMPTAHWQRLGLLGFGAAYARVRAAW